MLTPHRLIGLTLATLLVLWAPSAIAGEKGKDKEQTAGSEDCPGNSGNGNGHGHGRSCDENASQEEAPEQEETSSEQSAEEDESGGNGHPHGGPPGKQRANQQPTPSPSPSPSPSSPGTGQPPGHGDSGTLDVQVEVNRVVAQVGATLTYEIHVTNTGTSPVSAIVRNEIPHEVDLVSAVLPRRAAGAAPFGWSLENLAPGSVTTLRWTGHVARLGDLDAVNVVKVEGAGLESSAVETHTYLASVQGLRVHRSSSEPDWGTHTERRVVFRAADPDVAGAAGDPAGAPAQLPRTGLPVLEISYVAALLLLAGLVLLGKGKRLAAVGMMLVLVTAACTSEPPTTPSDDRDPGAEAAEERKEEKKDDRVLGTRVTKEDRKAPEEEDDGSGTGSTGVPGVDSDEDDETTDVEDPDGSDVATDDDEALVREVVLVPVPNQAPEPQQLSSTDASNTISLVWDQSSRSMPMATSSRLIQSGSPVEVLSSISDSGNGMNANVSLANITEDERLLARGHFAIEMIGADGTVIRLTAPPVDEVLDPGDGVSADFVLAAPSGSYTLLASFVAS